VAESPTSGTDETPVIVMFAPSGSLDRVYSSYLEEIPPGSGTKELRYEGSRVTAPVFLLLGRWDRVAVDLLPDDGLNNYEDLNNFWLAISPQTGTVTVAEPAAGEDMDCNGVLDPGEESQVRLGHQEDVNRNGVLDAGEDLDGDGVLDDCDVTFSRRLVREAQVSKGGR